MTENLEKFFEVLHHVNFTLFSQKHARRITSMTV